MIFHVLCWRFCCREEIDHIIFSWCLTNKLQSLLTLQGKKNGCVRLTKFTSCSATILAISIKSSFFWLTLKASESTLLTPYYLILTPNPSTNPFGSKFKQLLQSHHSEDLQSYNCSPSSSRTWTMEISYLVFLLPLLLPYRSKSNPFSIRNPYSL